MLLVGCVRWGCQPDLAMSGDPGGRSQSQAIADGNQVPSCVFPVHLHPQPHPSCLQPTFHTKPCPELILASTLVEIIQSMGFKIRGTIKNFGGAGNQQLVSIVRSHSRATISIALAMILFFHYVEECVMVIGRRESILSPCWFSDKETKGSVTRYSGSALPHYCTKHGKINHVMVSIFVRYGW
ncbi:unnamed protein product [Nyctereutes procyonoides]|uniref:(raccoon dog) hypothetical protein n=1 Tax=Nyctereutes procyonoides TaxID=34880 RepID=A0A811Z0S2_NYCPR|nr:unnamed protein product [Nyctereutes procyonoides]